MAEDRTAGIIASGTPSILRAYENVGRAKAGMYGAIAGGAVGLGTGIFKAAAKKREEDDIKEISDAVRASYTAGDPSASFEVLQGLRPKTLAGQKYLLSELEKVREASSRFIQDEATKAATEERKSKTAEAPVLAKARAWARANPNAQPPEEYLASEALANAVRQEQDQAREADEARSLEETEAFLGGRSPGDLTDEDLAKVKNPKTKGILRRERETVKGREATDARLKEKAAEDAEFRSLKAQGKVRVKDPDTGEVRVIPDVSSERFAERQKEREKVFRQRERSLALAEEKERRAAENDVQGDKAKSLSERRGALADYRAAFRLMQDDFGEMRDDVDPAEYKALYEKIQTMTGTLGEKAGSATDPAEALKAALRKALGK